MLLDRPTIVVSPLIALMADQERALKSRGIPVVLLQSRLRSAERRAALEQIERVVALSCSPRRRRSRHTPPRHGSSAPDQRSCRTGAGELVAKLRRFRHEGARRRRGRPD
jgi:superfamily II DNA helicase RecQ